MCGMVQCGMVQCVVWCSMWYGAVCGMVQCVVWCSVWYGAACGMVKCVVWCSVWYGAVCGMVYDKVYSIPDKLKFFRVMLNLFSKPGKLCFSVNSFFFLDKENLHSNSPGNSFTNTPSPQHNFRKPQERKVSIGSKYLQI